MNIQDNNAYEEKIFKCQLQQPWARPPSGVKV